MSDIYDAQLNPSKLDVLSKVLDAPAAEITKLAAYRFDDPAGEVGMEVHIVRTPDGSVVQVPLVYRGTPLEDVEEDELIAQMEHSVLGQRYVYLAMSDPVFAEVLDTVIAESRPGAEQFLVDGENRTPITEGIAQVRGTGSIDLAEEDEDVVAVVEVFAELDLEGLSEEEANEPGQLVGTWEGQDRPVLLAQVGFVYVDDDFEDDDFEDEDFEDEDDDDFEGEDEDDDFEDEGVEDEDDEDFEDDDFEDEDEDDDDFEDDGEAEADGEGDTQTR